MSDVCKQVTLLEKANKAHMLNIHLLLDLSEDPEAKKLWSLRSWFDLHQTLVGSKKVFLFFTGIGSNDFCMLILFVPCMQWTPYTLIYVQYIYIPLGREVHREFLPQGCLYI